MSTLRKNLVTLIQTIGRNQKARSINKPQLEFRIQLNEFINPLIQTDGFLENEADEVPVLKTYSKSIFLTKNLSVHL